MSDDANDDAGTPRGTAAWTAIRPLTRARRSDGSAYHREPNVEAQVRELSCLPDRERLRRLLQTGGDWNDGGRAQEETLVYFLREYLRRGNADAAWNLAGLLAVRVEKHVVRALSRWRLSREDAEDCARDLQEAMWRACFSDEPKDEFWEVRFWSCLDRKLWNLVQKRQATTDTELNPGNWEADREEETVDILLRQPDTQIRPEEAVEMKAALSVLSPQERQAIYLTRTLGLPEESDDPSRETAAKLMGVTGRSVRNYLRRAEEKIEAWQRGEETGRKGRKK